MARSASKKSNDDDYKELAEATNQKATAFIKSLLQQAATEQVEDLNSTISQIKALVENIGQASPFLIRRLAEEAKFDQGSAVAQRIKRVWLGNCEYADRYLGNFEEVDHYLHLVLLELELEQRLEKREREDDEVI